MSRFTIAEAALAVPRGERRGAARVFAEHHDAQVDELPFGPLSSLWIALTALLLRASLIADDVDRETAADVLAADGAIVLGRCRRFPRTVASTSASRCSTSARFPR